MSSVSFSSINDKCSFVVVVGLTASFVCINESIHASSAGRLMRTRLPILAAGRGLKTCFIQFHTCLFDTPANMAAWAGER